MAGKVSSIRDVAMRSGTSIATVSNVLNERGNVSEELQARVLKAAQELGYAASPIARSMRNRTTNTICVIVSDINCIFFAPVLKGIQKVLSAAKYNIMFYDSNYDPALERKYITAAKNSWADGLILAGLAHPHHTEFYKNIVISDQKHFPAISLENDLSASGFDSVLIDGKKAARTATMHLLELGCREIVHIKSPEITGASSERLQGYADALKEYGLPVNPSLVFPGDYSAISGYHIIQALIRANTKFDGVFAANDQMAVGALRALRDAGIEVPQSVKVVGYDNTFIASIVQPALTTISVPAYKMGVAAAKQLLARIDNPTTNPATIHMDYELMIRRSTIASARTGWDLEYW